MPTDWFYRIRRWSYISLMLSLLTCVVMLVAACGKDDSPAPSCVGTLPDGTTVALCPISAEQAKVMAFYARQTLVDSSGPLLPVSWSRLNTDCEKRMFVVQYTFSAGADPSGRPLTLRQEHFSEANLNQLARNPVNAVKGLRVTSTGFMGATQRLLHYNRTLASSKTNDIGWDVHFITIVNIDGICKVIDLSVGDEPIGIEEWLSGFCAAGECMYEVLEPFTAHILSDATKIPEDLSTASQDFMKELVRDFDIQNATVDKLPWYLTEYTFRQ